jgi:hypothetical protein
LISVAGADDGSPKPNEITESFASISEISQSLSIGSWVVAA